MPSGGASGAGVTPCAEVAIVKAKPATAINLSIVFLPWLEQSARGGFLAAPIGECMSLRFGLDRLDTDQERPLRRWSGQWPLASIRSHLPVGTMARAIVRHAHAVAQIP